MGDRNRHGGYAAFLVLSVCLCAGLTIAVTGSNAELPEQKTLWIAADDAAIAVDTSAGEVFFDFPITGTAHAAAVDPVNSLVWLKIGQRKVSAYDFGGQLQYSVELPENVHSPTWLEVDPGTGAVWVADPLRIFRIDPESGITFSHQQPFLSLDLIIGASVDPARSRFWYATTHNRLVAVAADGTELQTIELDWGIRSIAYDSFLDRLWVAGQEQLARYNAEGEQTFLSDTALSANPLAPDGQGGIWSSSQNKLQHVDQSGLIEFTLDPFPSLLESTQALVVDAETGDAWVASTSRLRHYTIDGSLADTLPARATDGTHHTVFGLALPRQIPTQVIIESPEAGALLNDNQPPVEIRVETPAETDAQDLSLTTNGDEVPVVCEQIDTGLYRCNPTAILPEGSNELMAHVENNAGIRFDSEPVGITVDTRPPEITITQPPRDLITNEPELIVAGNINEPAELTLNGESVDLDADLQFSRILILAEGQNALTFQATDTAGNVNASTRHPILDTQPPGPPQTGLIDGGEAEDGQTTVTGEPGSVESNAEVVISNNRTGASVTVQANEEGAFTAQIEGEPEDEFTLVIRDAAGNRSNSGTVTARGPNIPLDPADVAPEILAGGSPPLAERISFLHEGSDPIQKGVIPETIEAHRAAGLRGQVLNRDGDPIRAVRVSILNNPELGWTHTQLDGSFDMAVNGGGALTVVYEKEGYLPVQRTVQTEWEDWYHVDDVVMIPLDDQVITVDLTDDSQPFQVARGSVIEDSDGSRQATLLFPAGTVAEITLPDGSKQQLSQLDVRATEYTVGDNGPEAMPAQLPPTSAYTYAVELSVDQARDQGVKVAGKDVVFNQPVPFYIENFLDFPTGESVPTGYYDNDKGAWIPYENGRVIEILGEQNGLAILDVTGNGEPATAEELDVLGISEPERLRLSELYETGASLWRVALEHLSTWDCNWPYGPPEDAEEPDLPDPQWPEHREPENTDEENHCPGCIISAQQQSVGESIDITGTPYALHYRSKRADGYSIGNSMRVSLTGGTIPSSLSAVSVEISIAGALHHSRFSAQPNLEHVFSWDGHDGFGRKVYGGAEAKITIRHHYPCVYRPGNNGFARFGSAATAIGSRSRCRGFSFSQTWSTTLQSPFKQSPEVAGDWSLDPYHTWNSGLAKLVRGDGTERTDAFSLEREERVFAGTGESGYSGDGGPATEAKLARGGRYGAHYLAIGPDGTVYIMDDGNHRIRAVDTDGIIRTVAGNGSNGYTGDGGPAIEAEIAIGNRGRITAGPNGNVYFAQMGRHVVRRIAPDGTISTVAGTGAAGHTGDGGPATEARLNSPTDIAVAADGTLYITEYGNHDIRIVSPDGTISTVADVPLYFPMQLWHMPDGTLYVRDHRAACCSNRLWRVTPDGDYREETTLFSSGWPDTKDTDLPDAVLTNIGPDGAWYAASGDRVLKKAPAVGDAQGGYVVPNESGHQAYTFDEAGRHLETRSAYTGNVLYRFDLDDRGRLTAITDGEGNTTTIERDNSGNALAIVAPDDQRTSLTVDESGRLLNVTNPAGNHWSMQYTAHGLLTTYTDPKSHRNTFLYNGKGRLIQDIDPRGGGWLLTRTDLEDGYEVAMTSGEARVSRFSLQQPDDSTRLYRDESPDSTVTTRTYSDEGSMVLEQPDGTIRRIEESPDPRFGMNAPVITDRRVTIPSGLSYLQTTDREVVVPDADDQLSVASLTDTVTTNGRTATAIYDGDTREWTFTSPEGRTAALTLNGQDRPLIQANGGLEPVVVSYDSRGRLDSIRQGAGELERITTLEYYDASAGDQAGYLRSLIDAADRETGFAYDSGGRVTSQTLPDGREIDYEYDANGNLAAITPPGRTTHLFEYDGLDQRTLYEPPEFEGIESITRYRYNLDRQLISIELPGDRTVTFDYDTGGRLSSRSMDAGITSYTYNTSTGQVDTIIDPSGIELSLGWDGFLPIQTTWNGPISGTIARTFDSNFWLSAEAVNGNNIGFAYDNDGLVTQAGDVSLARNPDYGLVTATTLNAVAGNRSYNDFGELTGRSVSAAGNSIYGIAYERDRLGRVVEETETLGGETSTWGYQYDPAGRLIQVTLNGAITHSYSYDTNGNRIGYTGPQGNFAGTYDAQDRIESYGDAAYTHTPDGQLQSKTTPAGTITYNYDAAGNLRNVELPDGTAIEYLVDGRDRRVGKKVDGQLVQGWLYRDQLNPVAELDGQGDVVARFVYAEKPNVPAYMVKGGTTYRIVSDHLGSVRLVINTDTREIAQRMDYSPFGQVITDTNPGFQPFGFAGGLYDASTGLVRFGARDYDPEIGRWTARDPILFSGHDTNLYGYTLNDPVNFIDPNGKLGLPGAAIGATVGGISSFTGALSTGASLNDAAIAGAIGSTSGALTGALGGMGIIGSSALGGFSNLAGQLIGRKLGSDVCSNAGINWGSVAGSSFGGGWTAGITKGAGPVSAAVIGWGPSTASGAIGTSLGQ